MTAPELLAARKALGMSQKRFAEALGLSRPSIARWEAGRDIPRVVELAILGLGRKRRRPAPRSSFSGR